MTTPLNDKKTRVGAKPSPLKVFIRAAVALLTVWVLFFSGGVVFPVQGEIESQSDAVVSLAPQKHRLFTALQVAEVDNPEALVISHFDGQMGLNGSGESQQQIDVTEYCQEHQGNGVICFTPSEDATIGEAIAVREIAAQESWETLTVVTSRHHALRANYIFEQCVGEDIDVNLMHSDADNLSASEWFWHLLYENAAFFKALWQTTTRC